MSLSMADVHLISMRPEMTGVVVPGKLYGVMAAGRPAIFVGPRLCESADAIRTAGCGITIDRGDVDGLVAALTHLAGDPSLARRMGERGRSAFLAAYERRLCCGQWHEVLADLTGAAADSSRPARIPWRQAAARRTASAVAVVSAVSNFR
jgi:glycosyltransferase involved in cell wall biosynthesis